MATQRFKVYIGAQGDLVRDSNGTIRVFTDIDEAQRVARAEHGMVLPLNASSPGGFDRTWA